MKEYALEIAGHQANPRVRLNILREYVQAYLLKIMQDKGAFRSYAFVGGTALRFLYDLPRFSEDLDFSLTGSPTTKFTDLMKKVKSELEQSGYAVDVKVRDAQTVHSALFRFSDLLFEAGLSPLAGQKFTVKVEVDSHPPTGARTEIKVVNKYFPITFLSYDTASLLSGKLHAILSRKYTKGRDLFDLGWYLSRWKQLTPNLNMLTSALAQTGWNGPVLDENNWRDIVGEAVGRMDWAKVVADVDVFLQDPSDMKIFSQENILALIRGE